MTVADKNMVANALWIKYIPGILRLQFEGSHERQKIVSNIGWLVADKLIRMSVGLLVGVWIARYLGPEQFGALNFAFAFVALFSAVSSLGLDAFVVYDIVRNPEQKYRILATAFLLKLCGGITAFLASSIVITVIRPHDSQTQWLVAIIAAGLIFQSFDAIDLWFQSQVRSKYTVIIKNIAFLTLSVAKIILILVHARLMAFAVAGLIEIILGFAGLVVLYGKQQGFSSWRPEKNIALQLLVRSWPLILSGIAVMLYMRIDQVMLAQMIGNKEVGLYSAALSLSEVWYFIPSVIVSSVMPSLTQAKLESREIYLIRLQQLFNGLIRIAYLIAIPLTFISTWLVTLLYGPGYSSSGVILAIHIWAAVFVFLGVGSTPWTINEKTMQYSLYQTILGLMVNIFLNLWLIPNYGGIGAAIATLISQMVASFLVNALFPRMRTLFLIQLKALTRPVGQMNIIVR